MLELFIAWALMGLLCDQIMARRAKKQNRPYGLFHFCVAMLFGGVIIPLSLVIWLALMIGWQRRRG